MPSLGGMIANPFMQFIYSMINGGQQQGAMDEANRMNEERFNIGTQLGRDALQGGMATYDADSQNALDELTGLTKQSSADIARLRRQMTTGMHKRTGEVMGDYDQASRGYNQGLDAFMRNFGDETQSLLSGYGDRYRNAEGDLNQLSDQQQRDIDASYRTREKGFLANQADRGFANSTANIGVQNRMNEDRQAEQRRASDDNIRRRTDILSSLSGDTLAAQGNRAAQGEGYGFSGMGQKLQNNMGRANMLSGLMGDELNTLQGMGQWGIQNNQANRGNLANFYGQNAANRSNLWTTGLNNLQNWFGGRNDSGPTPNNMSFQFGQNSVQPPSPPSGLSALFSGLMPGLGQGVGMGMAAPGGLPHMFGHPFGWGQ